MRADVFIYPAPIPQPRIYFFYKEALADMVHLSWPAGASLKKWCSGKLVDQPDCNVGLQFESCAGLNVSEKDYLFPIQMEGNVAQQGASTKSKLEEFSTITCQLETNKIDHISKEITATGDVLPAKESNVHNRFNGTAIL